MWNTDESGNGNYERTGMGGNGNEEIIPAHLYCRL
jgi:hypothetical protein